MQYLVLRIQGRETSMSMKDLQSESLKLFEQLDLRYGPYMALPDS